MSRFTITRTVEKTEVTCLCFDKTTAEPFNKTIVLADTYKDAKVLERKAAKVIEADPNIKFIEVVDTHIASGVYGITEEDFFNHCIELDPRTRKPLK